MDQRDSIEPDPNDETKAPAKTRRALFLAVVAGTCLLMGFILLISPLASPYEGTRPGYVIAIPALIALLLAAGLGWFAWHAWRAPKR
ncbi:MAG: hypothetical protein AAF321_05905 [Pseudomonadota bacterium]